MNTHVQIANYESNICRLLALMDEEVNMMLDRADALDPDDIGHRMDEYQMGIMDENYRSLMTRMFTTMMLLNEVRFKLMLKRMDMGMDTSAISKVDEPVMRALETFKSVASFNGHV